MFNSNNGIYSNVIETWIKRNKLYRYPVHIKIFDYSHIFFYLRFVSNEQITKSRAVLVANVMHFTSVMEKQELASIPDNPIQSIMCQQ